LADEQVQPYGKRYKSTQTAQQTGMIRALSRAQFPWQHDLQLIYPTEARGNQMR